MYFRAINDRSPVAVVTGIVANMRNKIAIDGYVPNSEVQKQFQALRKHHQFAGLLVAAANRPAI